MSTKIMTKSILSNTRIHVEAEQDPLKLFFSGMKSKETKEAYIETLREFLFSIEELNGMTID